MLACYDDQRWTLTRAVEELQNSRNFNRLVEIYINLCDPTDRLDAHSWSGLAQGGGGGKRARLTLEGEADLTRSSGSHIGSTSRTGDN